MRLPASLAALAALSASMPLLPGVAADYSYPDAATAFPGHTLVLNEEFSGPALNSTLWTPDWDCSGWGNGMRAAYTTSPKNLYLQDGMLHLNPICGRLQPDKSICQPFSGYPECACEPTNVNPVDATGAQITTRHRFAFNKGKFRVRAKMSTGFYTWPAFWLYRDWKKGEEMPVAGEIDIMEGVGKRPQWWTAVIHYLTKDAATGELKDKVRNSNDDWTNNLNDSFHVYGLDWSDGLMVWTVDETVMWKVDYAKLFSDPSNVNVFDDGYFYIILDVAVGGRMFGIGYGAKKPPYDELCADANTFTPTIVDYVRLYQLSDRVNYTTGAGPDLVKGSSVPGSAVPDGQGAACPFDGCVGSSWNQRVNSILGISGDETTTTTTTRSTSSRTTTSKTKTSKTSSTTLAVESTGAVLQVVTTSRPSGARGASVPGWIAGAGALMLGAAAVLL
ncbi:concanavalin A-like lectin/glucanase domain-containing protein [Hyaloraphidium curvatum]|nr:concanavalin A-like lectin/glucanase domain-containing protein [Hyaloraphidium curvatum]